MINTAFFGTLRPGSFLVNTARGAVVAMPDLLAALDAGILSGAGLDVLPGSPFPGTRHCFPIRVVLTPHAAFFSLEAEQELRRKAAQNLITSAVFRAARLYRSAGNADPVNTARRDRLSPRQKKT